MTLAFGGMLNTNTVTVSGPGSPCLDPGVFIRGGGLRLLGFDSVIFCRLMTLADSYYTSTAFKICIFVTKNRKSSVISGTVPLFVAAIDFCLPFVVVRNIHRCISV